MLNGSNAYELAPMAKKTGALVFRGQLRYPGPVHSASLSRRSEVLADTRQDCPATAGLCLLREPADVNTISADRYGDGIIIRHSYQA